MCVWLCEWNVWSFVSYENHEEKVDGDDTSEFRCEQSFHEKILRSRFNLFISRFRDEFLLFRVLTLERKCQDVQSVDGNHYDEDVSLPDVTLQTNAGDCYIMKCRKCVSAAGHTEIHA